MRLTIVLLFMSSVAYGQSIDYGQSLYSLESAKTIHSVYRISDSTVFISPIWNPSSLITQTEHINMMCEHDKVIRNHEQMIRLLLIRIEELEKEMSILTKQ